MAYGPVNVAGMTQKDLDAVTAIVQIVLDRIGATADTGGSVEGGTLMAKDNRLIADLAEHMGIWTAARAGHIDTIKTDAAASKNNTEVIGAAGDGGGSTKAGTVMAKLNKLLSDLASGVETINTVADQVKALKNKGVVKSLQRGSGSDSQSIIDIPINAVNPDKCLVKVECFSKSSTTAAGSKGYMLEALSETNLRLKCGNTGGSVSSVYIYYWEIIEFY